MKYSLLLIFGLLLFQSCQKPTNGSKDMAAQIKEVENKLCPPVYFPGDPTWTIEERMAHYGVPGVSIAVIKGRKIAWMKNYGITNKESKEPVSSTTLFQAASISKPVSAYGALRLVEQNKIDLDKNINNYLTSWQLAENEFTKEKKVALKHLLSHSGGVTVHGFLGYSPDLPVPSLVEILSGSGPANSSAITVDKLAEESFRYSGGGYCIMQQLMIDVSGKAFPALMDELVLKNLGMDKSTFDQPLKTEQLQLAATGYLPNGDMTKGKRHTYPEMAAAGLWTTAEDLAKFAINIQQTIKGESQAILSKEMATKMLTPFVEEYSGLGIFITKKKEQLYFGHGGWNEGFSSQLTAHKNNGYGVVVMTNSNHPAFIEELIRSVALTYDWDDFVPTYKRFKTSPTELLKVVGRYRVHSDELIDVYQSKGRLFKKNLGAEAVELFNISNNTYISSEEHQPMRFRTNAEHGQAELHILNPDKNSIESTYTLLKEGEKLPFEFLEAGDFEQALSAYQRIKKTDPNDPAIQEDGLNRGGYKFLNKGNIETAKNVFKINTLLYPNSFNAYDSYAEACMINKDFDLAIVNYKKSLRLNSDNSNATNMIAEMQKDGGK